MRLKEKIIIKGLNWITSSSSFRYIIFRFLGLNNYISLIIKSLDVKGNNLAKKNILYVQRTLFEKDIDQLIYRVRKYGWIMLKKSQITLYQEDLIPKRFRRQKDFLKHKDKIPNEWIECVRRSKVLLKKLRREKHVCALMIANLDYWQEHALQLACKELGIPIIILSKEYIYNDQWHLNFFKNHFKDISPIYDAVMVFGERMKNVLSELKGFDKDKIFSTGAPRIDRWRSLESFEDKAKSILIFSFRFDPRFPSMLTPNLKDKNSSETNSSETVFFKLLKGISKYSQKNNIRNIIVKTRNKIDNDEIEAYFKKNEIEGITLTYDADNYDLILQSKLVIGINSLAIIESMFSKVPIIIPDWFILEDSKKMFSPNDEFCSKAVEICKNEESLLKSIDRLIEGDITEVSEETYEARKKFISNFWEYDPAISASRKVQNVIDKYV